MTLNRRQMKAQRGPSYGLEGDDPHPRENGIQPQEFGLPPRAPRRPLPLGFQLCGRIARGRTRGHISASPARPELTLLDVQQRASDHA